MFWKRIANQNHFLDCNVGKMSLLMDHTAHPGNVADPWYTEDFEATWQDVLDGCQGLLKEFMTERGDSNGTKR